MARPSKVELTIHQIAKSTEIVAALDKAKATGAAAVNVLASPILFSNSKCMPSAIPAKCKQASPVASCF